MAVIVKCEVCSNDIEVPATDEQIKAWKSGMLIQRAMPNLTADQREILISGTCGPCFDKMFPPDPEEEEALNARYPSLF